MIIMETNKRDKGNSIIEALNEYIVIDIETTGLDSRYDRIIEVAAIKVKDGIVVDRFSELIKPSSYSILGEEDIKEESDYLLNGTDYIQYVDSFITELTGITNQMLKDARDEGMVLSDFYGFVGSNSILVGYNVNFDINFLYDELSEIGIQLKNDYVDVMRIARRVKPSLEHHRQRDLAEVYGINNDNAHRAENDCIVCNQIYCNLIKDITISGLTFDEFKKSYNKSYSGIDVKSITSRKKEFDTSHPLYGKSVVFTGTLERMQRKVALQIVADFGGIPTDSVTKNTNYLVLGNNDYCKTIKGGKSSKQKKAESLILKGADLQILSESVFYDMIEG